MAPSGSKSVYGGRKDCPERQMMLLRVREETKELN